MFSRMRRWRSLLVGTAGVLAAGLGGLIPAWDSLGVWRGVIIASMVISIVALVMQQRDSGAVRIPFAESDWRPVAPDGYELRIPYRRHGRRNPNCEMYMFDDAENRLMHVMCGQTLDGGDVVVHIGVRPIKGEAHIH